MLKTTKIEEVKESDYMVVLDPPEAPLDPSKPKKRIMVVLAGVLGLGLGTLIGFLKEYAGNSDKDNREKMSQAKILIIKNITDFLPRRFKR